MTSGVLSNDAPGAAQPPAATTIAPTIPNLPQRLRPMAHSGGHDHSPLSPFVSGKYPPPVHHHTCGLRGRAHRLVAGLVG